jgi:hypothetical protein
MRAARTTLFSALEPLLPPLALAFSFMYVKSSQTHSGKPSLEGL